MKKQVFVMLAALFALMLALFMGAYAADTSTDTETAALNAAADVYAILYDDGTLVFQHGNTPETGKNVTKMYEVDLTAHYAGWSVPWGDKRESVRVVSFADKVSPTSTAYWFYDCENLERVDNTQNLDTVNVTDMGWMFRGCGALTTLDVSGFDTAKVTSMEGMFVFCSNLTELDTSKFNTTNVTNMKSMFLGCSALETVDVSHFDTAKVTNMCAMFEGCCALRILDVSNFNTTNVTNMQSMFQRCEKLTVLDVSGFDTANVTNMRNMFITCGGLTKLDVSGFDTANVTDVGRIFANCYGLKTIYASGKFSIASTTESSEMFSVCRSLVGGNGTKYDESHTDKEYARIDTADAPGYFTAKDAASVAYAISAATPDNGKLSVTLSNPAAVTVAVSCFDANGQFVSAPVQSVQANAGTVTLPLSAGTRKACVMLFDSDYRPMCAPLAAVV